MKKTDLEEKVELAGSGYYNMLRSVIETFPRESMGDLIGRKNKNLYFIFNSYPVQTSKRKYTEVYYGNNQAIKRVRRFNKAVNRIGGLGTGLIGGYHSHTTISKQSKRVYNHLSKRDINFIRDEIKELKRNYWIEIILGIKEKNYQKRRRVGETSLEYGKRLKVKIYDTESHSYSIIISAYKLERTKNDLIKKGLQVRKKSKTK